MNRLLSVLLTTTILIVSSFSQAQIVDIGTVIVHGELVSRSGNYPGSPITFEVEVECPPGVTCEEPDTERTFRACTVSDSVEGATWTDSFHLAINTATNKVVNSETTTVYFKYIPGAGTAEKLFFRLEESPPPVMQPNFGNDDADSGTLTESFTSVYRSNLLGEQFRGTDTFTVSETYTDYFGGQHSTFCKETWTITGYLSTTPPAPEQEDTITNKIKRLTHEALRDAGLKPSSNGALKVKSRVPVIGVRG